MWEPFPKKFAAVSQRHWKIGKNIIFARFIRWSIWKSWEEKLYVKITEVIHAEVNAITEQDCIDYIRNLVIERTFNGYLTEKVTVYEQLQSIVGVEIQPAPDEWDRLYNVDFSVAVGSSFIGLQIKPMTFFNASEHYKWREVQKTTHQKFQKKFGGAVFTVVSVKRGAEKVIANPEIIAEIQQEIDRLNQLN